MKSTGHFVCLPILFLVLFATVVCLVAIGTTIGCGSKAHPAELDGASAIGDTAFTEQKIKFAWRAKGRGSRHDNGIALTAVTVAKGGMGNSTVGTRSFYVSNSRCSPGYGSKEGCTLRIGKGQTRLTVVTKELDFIYAEAVGSLIKLRSFVIRHGGRFCRWKRLLALASRI
jgi:hypothetical protein